LDALIEKSLALGATRAQALCVTTPAHTRWLDAAVPRFAEALQANVREPLRIPMLSGIDASRLRTAKDAVLALSRQLATRLDWAACMDAIAEVQADAVVEIGPGNALARMIMEAAPDVRARALDEFRDPAAAVAWISRQTRA
jgi:[acyl-carrier-protein] S-malonyltransferase